MSQAKNHIASLQPFTQDVSILDPSLRFASPGLYASARTWEFITQCLPDNVAGWTALEAGAKEGVFSILLKKYGIGRVVAIEDSAERAERIGHLAHGVGENVETLVWPELKVPANAKPFDLVLTVDAFRSGAFPYKWLEDLARLTRKMLIVEAGVEPALRDPRCLRRYDKNGDRRWTAGPEVVMQMLSTLGFDQIMRLPYSPGKDFENNSSFHNEGRVFLLAIKNIALPETDLVTKKDEQILQISDASIVDNHGNSAVIQSGDKFWFACHISADNKEEHYHACLRFYRDAHLVTSATSDHFTGKENDLAFEFEHLPLAAGTYEIVLSIYKQGADLSGRPAANFTGWTLHVTDAGIHTGKWAVLETHWQANAGCTLQHATQPLAEVLSTHPMELRNASGEITAEVTANEAMRLKLPVEPSIASEENVWELSLHRGDGVLVHACSSQTGGLIAPDPGGPEVSFSSLPLQEGFYEFYCRVLSRHDGLGHINYPALGFRILPDKEPCPGLLRQKASISPPVFAGDLSAQDKQGEAITILQANLHDDCEKEEKVIQSGDPLSVRVRFTVNDPPPGAVLRVQILNPDDGLLLWGTNSQRAGINLADLAPGIYEMSIKIDRLLLLGGQYMLRVSAWSSNEPDGNHTRCYGTRTIALPVMTRNQSGMGKCFLQPHWIEKRPEGFGETRPHWSADVHLASKDGQRMEQLESGSEAYFQITLQTSRVEIFPDLMVVIDDEEGSRLVEIPLGQAGLRIARMESRSELRLEITSLPLSPGTYRARVFVYTHLREKPLDPPVLLTLSDPYDFAVTGEAGDRCLFRFAATATSITK